MRKVELPKALKDLRRGDTRKITARLSYESTPIPANGTLTLTLKIDPEDTDEDAILRAYATRTDDDLVNPDGLITLQLTEEDTTKDLGKYWYDLQFVSTDGTFIQTVLPVKDAHHEKMEIYFDVTHSKVPVA